MRILPCPALNANGQQRPGCDREAEPGTYPAKSAIPALAEVRVGPLTRLRGVPTGTHKTAIRGSPEVS